MPPAATGSPRHESLQPVKPLTAAAVEAARLDIRGNLQYELSVGRFSRSAVQTLALLCQWRK